MHVPTGKISRMASEELEKMDKSFSKGDPFSARQSNLDRKMVALTDMEADELKEQSPTKRKGYMRNQPCPCGSAKKFKRCCWRKFQ